MPEVIRTTAVTSASAFEMNETSENGVQYSLNNGSTKQQSTPLARRKSLTASSKKIQTSVVTRDLSNQSFKSNSTRKWKSIIWQAMEEDNRIAIPIMATIFMSTALFVLESEWKDESQTFFILETVAIIIFTIEFGIRLFTCPSKKYFFMDWLNWVDMFSIMPYYITLYMRLYMSAAEAGGFPVIRVIRLLRVFRAVKVGRYSYGFRLFADVINASRDALQVQLIVMAIAMIVFAAVINLCESEIMIPQCSGDEDPGVVCQPNSSQFNSVPRSLWWALITMTTVGYGDAYPVTGMGKIVGSLTALSGILIIAMPVSVIGANFSRMYSQNLAEPDQTGHTSGTDVNVEGLERWFNQENEKGMFDPPFVDLEEERVMAFRFMEKYGRWNEDFEEKTMERHMLSKVEDEFQDKDVMLELGHTWVGLSRANIHRQMPRMNIFLHTSFRRVDEKLEQLTISQETAVENLERKLTAKIDSRFDEVMAKMQALEAALNNGGKKPKKAKSSAAPLGSDAPSTTEDTPIAPADLDSLTGENFKSELKSKKSKKVKDRPSNNSKISTPGAPFDEGDPTFEYSRL